MKKIWELWKHFAKAIGDFQFKLLFSLLYILIFTPVGILVSLLIDPLSKRKPLGWTKFKDNTSTLERVRKQ